MNFVGKDPAFLNALNRVVHVGTSEAPVLLTGETGTGKELARVRFITLARDEQAFYTCGMRCFAGTACSRARFSAIRAEPLQVHIQTKKGL